jgi:hypothetical protein
MEHADAVNGATVSAAASLTRELQLGRSEPLARSAADSNAPQPASAVRNEERDVAELTNAELVQLRIRVIALENVMITLLAAASDRQLDLVREMAATISPRPGSTQHPLTLHAANQMNHLVDRAGHFRVEPAS